MDADRQVQQADERAAQSARPQVRVLAEDTSPEGTPLPDVTDLISQIGAPAGTPPVGPVNKGIVGDETIEAAFQSAIEQTETTARTHISPYKSPDTSKYLEAAEGLNAIFFGNAADIKQQREQYEAATEKRKQAESERAAGEKELIQEEARKASILSAWHEHFNKIFGVGGNEDRLVQKTQMHNELSDYLVKFQTGLEGLKDSVARDAEELRQESSVNFLDDPGRWLAGIFKIPQLHAKVQAGVQEIGIKNDQAKGLDEALREIQTDIDSTVANNKAANEARAATLPTTTAAQAAAKSKIVAAQATEASAKADQDLIQQNSRFAGQAFSEASTMTNERKAQLQLEMEAEKTKWDVSVQEALKGDRIALIRLKLAQLLQDKQDSDVMRVALQNGGLQLGLPEGTLTKGRFKALKPDQQGALLQAAVGFYGATPGDAFETWTLNRRAGNVGPNLAPQVNRILVDTEQWLQQQLASPAFTEKLRNIPKAEQAEYIKNTVNKRFDDFRRNPASDPQHNPFYEVNPAQVLQTLPKLAGTELGKALQTITSNSPSTKEVIAVLRGAAKTPEAGDKLVAQYYQLNTRVRNALVDYRRFGTVGDTTYIYNQESGGGFFNNKVITTDLTNETQVRKTRLQIELNDKLLKARMNDTIIAP